MFQRLLTLSILVGIGTQVAASGALQKPRPGPEHQRLEFFVGKWPLEGEDASGGKLKAISTCEWFESHFQVICQSDVTWPESTSKELQILTYDADSAAYTATTSGVWVKARSQLASWKATRGIGTAND